MDNLPLAYMTMKLGKKIEETIRLVQEVDVQEDGVLVWGQTICGSESKLSASTRKNGQHAGTKAMSSLEV